MKNSTNLEIFTQKEIFNVRINRKVRKTRCKNKPVSTVNIIITNIKVIIQLLSVELYLDTIQIITMAQ